MKKMKSSKFSGPAAIVSGLLVVGSALMTPAAVHGYNSYKDIISVPKQKVVYQNVKAVQSPGSKWATDFVSQRIDGAKEWSLSKSLRPSNPISPEICNLGDVPKTSLLTASAGGSGYSVHAQIFGAGQGRQAFENYKKNLSSCNEFEEVKNWSNSGISFVKFENSIIATAGDSIVGFTAPNRESLDKNTDKILSRMKSSLTESECKSLSSNPEDRTRSFFYDRKAYKGFTNKTDLKANVNTNDFSNPILFQTNEIDYPNLQVPEAPLPKDFPDKLPASVNEPSENISAPEKDDYSGTAVYYVPDDDGPGCGWTWSGQESPVYDRADLDKKKEEKITNLQNSLDEKANGYNNSRRAWTVDSMEYMSQLHGWNAYVKEHNAVTDKWKWLNDQREEFKPQWDAWVEEYNKWKNFPELQKEAQDEWNKDLKICRDQRQAYDDWNKTYGDKWREEQRLIEEYNRQIQNPIFGGGRGTGIFRFVLPAPGPTPPVPPAPSPTPTPEPSPTEEATQTSEPSPTVEPSSPAPSESPAPTQEPSPSSPVPSPPTVTVPGPPNNCPTDPEAPAILSETQGSEPQAPTPPEGVTVPKSWADPRN